MILVGERLATVPGALSAALTLAGTTGARLAWVPRRAGERGALETGCLPNLLPGGRPVADAAARVDLGTVWGATVPPEAGRDGDAIVAAAAAGELTALVVAGVDPADLPDPAGRRRGDRERPASWSASRSAPAPSRAAADVVFPVAPVAEKAGMFVDWEGRVRPFEKVLRESHALPDLRVLSGIADEMGVRLGFRTVDEARAEMQDLGAWDGERARIGRPTWPRRRRSRQRDQPTGRVRLATWKLLLDDGRMLDGDDYLKATAAHDRSRWCRRRRWRASASPPASTSRSPATAAARPCRWASPTCPTASCGRRRRAGLGVAAGSDVRLTPRTRREHHA